MKFKLVYIVLIIIFGISCSPFRTQKTKTFIGPVDNRFHLSNTNNIHSEKRQELENDINIYSNKIDLLNSYYDKVNKGDIQSAEKILQTDTILAKQDDFQLAYMFSLAKMKELGVLYKPCLQVNDSSIEAKLIFCNEKQLKDLTAERGKIFELDCKYIGYLILDKTHIYQLKSYK